MSPTARERDLVFNLVWIGDVFTELRYFAESLIDQSEARYRFVANGCTKESVEELVAYQQAHADRIVEVFDVGDLVAHGQALDRVLAERDDGELFCFVDTDIKAKAPWIGPFLDVLAEHDAVTSGSEVWTDENVVPPGHLGVGGRHFYDERGFVFGSPHLGLYRRQALEATVGHWGIGFGSAGPELSEEAAGALRGAGHEYLVYDTGKIVNVLLQASGYSLVHVESPHLVHIGGVSQYLSPAAYVELDGELEPEWAPWEGMAPRLEVARYTAKAVRALAAGGEPPVIPEGLDPVMDGKLRMVREEMIDLMARHGTRR